MFLAGDSTHTGTITATAGTLVLKGDRTAATGAVKGRGAILRLANGAVFGGSVSFQSTRGGTDAAQTNAPNLFGDSPGHVTILGTMSVEEGGIVQFDINGPTPGTQYDRVDIGNLSLAQTSDAFLDIVVDGFTPVEGQAFFILNNQGSSPITGEFTNAPEGSLISSNGQYFSITYFADADTQNLTNGNDVALIAVAAPVPEPVHLMALTMATLLMRRTSRPPTRQQLAG